VVRLAHLLRPNRGVINRLVGFSSFTASAAVASLAMRGFDIVIGTVPQPLLPLAAWMRSLTGKTKFVLEIRDLWPESLVAAGQGATDSMAYVGLNRIADHLYQHADHVIAVTDAIRDRVVTDWGVPAERVDVIRAAVDADSFEVSGDGAEHKKRWCGEGKLIVTYVGTLGNAHGLEIILDAAASLAGIRPEIEFLFVGDGAEGARLRESAHGMSNVRFLGVRPRADLPSIYAASDICVAVLRDDPLFTTVVPNKMYEYMAAGKPIICNVVGEASSLVESASAGVITAPGSSAELVEAVTRLADDAELRETMGQNGFEWVRENAVWHSRAEAYAAIFERITTSDSLATL
jgi:colanic acid biosynthesis glycosyl transferase WcaI